MIRSGTGYIAKPGPARHPSPMKFRAICVLAAAALLALAGVALHGGELPPAAGLSESATQERAALFAALAAAKDDADARAIEDRIWKFWLSFADAESQRLLEGSREAQLRFDYGNALVHLQKLVEA